MNSNILEIIKNTASITWITNPKSADKWRFFTTELKISDALSDLYVLSIDPLDFEFANEVIKELTNQHEFEFQEVTNIQIPDEILSHEWMCKSEQLKRMADVCNNKSNTIQWFEENRFSLWDCYNRCDEIFTHLDAKDKRYILGIDTEIKAIVLKNDKTQCVFIELDNIPFWRWCKANDLKLQSIFITNRYESGIRFNEDNICDSLGISNRYSVPSTISEYIDNIYLDKDEDGFDIYRVSLEFEEYRCFIDLIKKQPITYDDIAKILRCRDLPEEIAILIKNRLIELISIKEPYYWEIAALLNSSHISEDVMTFIQRIIDKELCDCLESFYESCVNQNSGLIALQYIKESDYVNWSEDNQEEMINHICSRIIEGDSFLLVPDFLKKERDILMSFVEIYWENGSEEEQDVFKEIVKETGLSGDLDFILETFKHDDGSISWEIADETIMESAEYWLKCSLAWENAPREGTLEPDDYEMNYSVIPKKFKDDLSFNINLISEMPHFIHALSDKFKENHEICQWALAQDGMLLKYLSDKIKNNEDLTAIAISQNPQAVEFISDKLTHDLQYVKRVIDANPNVLKYCFPRMKQLYERG